MGTGLNAVLRSQDGGHTWTSAPVELNSVGFISAFAILRDGTFVVAGTVGTMDMRVARSTDQGKTWTMGDIDVDRSPHTQMSGWNSDMLELADGTILLTVELRSDRDVLYKGQSGQLPIQLRGFSPYVLRSRDGGRTWGDKSIIAMYAGETHLLAMPSGKLMACIRKQRHHRLPGDPADPMTMKLEMGFQPQFPSEEQNNPHDEGTNRSKNMFVTESYDQGYTWVNERRVSGFLQCSGDLTLTRDGVLLLAFDHRYADDIAGDGVRVMASYDLGKTWEIVTYIIGQGTDKFDTAKGYPSSIATEDGGLITVCANHVGGDVARLEAVHWAARP
ncbi:MAG: sialidase family protein [Pirellulaceae bacterium]|nr:sialidase family protein [Pirellulaceae bacterium]